MYKQKKGRAVNSGGTYTYEYNLGDHLGNIRVSFDKNNLTQPRQQDDYYPFGLEISRGTIPSVKNEYLYNKKELQEELTQYDYGARFYDPVIGRWTTIDPLAELERRGSPYGYTFDDPIRHTDPDGMFGEDVVDDDGGDGDCCKVMVGATAGGIMGGATAAAATVAIAGTGTVVGAPAGYIVAAGILTGGAIGAGSVWLWNHFANNSAPEPDHLNGGNKLPPEQIKLPPSNQGIRL